MIKVIRKATDHFFEFHKGTLNIVCHIVGFAVLFYSIFRINWLLFAISLFLLEAGDIYNHFAGIKPYDFRPKITFWRILIFLVLIGLFYLITVLIKSS